MSRRRKIVLVHQGLWEMEKLTMPLAAGYLKAMVLSDEVLNEEFAVTILTYGGGATVSRMAAHVVAEQPDILGCSVFGWNYHTFGRLSDAFHQMNPHGWCIWGGPQVAQQGERVFRLYPGVDIVVNGEGELPFVELLRAYLRGASAHDLSAIRGISFVQSDGSVATTPDQPRFKSLDEVPSPFLTGALPLRDERGEFPYDFALMETNRGCPYQCAFCYWGSAVGQKLSKFGRDRLKEELELFGRLGVENVALCDANFGMLPNDRVFIEDMLEVRAATGFPRNLVCSWAKNKSKVFYGIVELMHESRLAGDFTLALQTLAPDALKDANRTNMKLNEFEDLAAWLKTRNLPCYAELMWGLPGETYDSFLVGYDQTARYTSRIATYTNLLLPNTEYDAKRREHEFVTVRGENTDFEFILSHRTMSFADNVRMHRFLFWARVIAEHLFLRVVWHPLRELANISQSTALLSLDRWIDSRPEPAAQNLRLCRSQVVDNLDSSRIGHGLRCLYTEPGMQDLFALWWEEAMLPMIDARLRDAFRQLFAYDLATQPIHGDSLGARDCLRLSVHGDEYFVRSLVPHAYDFDRLVELAHVGDDRDPLNMFDSVRRESGSSTLYYKAGFEKVVDNHEVVLFYVGRQLSALEDDARTRADPSAALAAAALATARSPVIMLNEVGGLPPSAAAC